jgi:S1-C subfamily serine protease
VADGAATLARVATVDWIALAVVVLSALGGLRRGLVFSALSLTGLVVGAYVGSRIAPHLVHNFRWTPLAGLIGALAGALLLQTLASIVGSTLRGGLKLTPLRLLDSAGGFVLGVATGLVLVWVVGATVLLIPGQPTLRREVQRSEFVRRLNEVVPPRQLLDLLARIDPFQTIVGPAAPAEPASPAIARAPGVVKAEASVVKVIGTACGVGIEGSGWFATISLVVTNAHVVAGEHDTKVEIPGYRIPFDAFVVAFDSRNDVAVLRVLGAVPQVPLRMTAPRAGTAVAIVGFPQNGPLRVTPGRIGSTSTVLTRDVYGHGPLPRTITAVAGRIRHGNSGGPAVDAQGFVHATIFAARVGAPSGYAVPTPIVRRALAGVAQEPVSTGDCAAG